MTEVTINAVESEHGTKTRLIKDSISVDGDRVTTFEVRLWRAVLAELNTHRVFSRNSASSRAIPLAKQIERVMEDPAMPLVWASEKPGMSGGVEVDRPDGAEELWRNAALVAVGHASVLGQLGVHKSIANRLLEPYMWHTVVITATSYKNFFGLRCSPNAQPEIRIAAEQMYDLFNASEPRPLTNGEWHLPYIEDAEIEQADQYLGDNDDDLAGLLVKMSSARCAAVSYMRHADWRSVEKDVDLYTKLTSADPMHASPLEHPCTPMPSNKHEVIVESRSTGKSKTLTLPRYGNFAGWHQHRFDVEVDRDYQAFA